MRDRVHSWARWTAANGLGELVGLGGAFVFGVALSRGLGEPHTIAVALAYLAAVLLIAVCEGAAVATAQWLVLGKLLTVPRRSWLIATLAGTLIAWLLGMVPSSLATFHERSGQPLPEPSQRTVLVMATIMGAALGAILAFPQALVLRRVVKHPFRWIPANALAWAAGMPLIFGLVGITIGRRDSLDSIVLLVCGIGFVGAIVGSIHGLWLVRFVPLDQSGESSAIERQVAS